MHLYEEVFNPKHLFSPSLRDYFDDEGFRVTIHDFTVDLTDKEKLIIKGGDSPTDVILQNKQGTFYLKDKHVRRISGEHEFLKEVIEMILTGHFFKYFEKRD